MTGTRLTIRQASMAAVTDLGRVRGPQAGLPVNGALDQYSARAANILVGNADNTPLIEVTAFGFEFDVDADTVIAITGADTRITVDGLERPAWQPVPVSAGQTVRLSAMTAGVRCYIAVHGGLEVPRLYGSCAPDTVIGFGTFLAPGTTVASPRAMRLAANPFLASHVVRLRAKRPSVAGTAVVDVILGPDDADFEGTAHRLFDGRFQVTPHSNHIGLRMTGDLPERVRSTEMISRGVPVGAVEVPPGDELLILHRGRGVTAGYPVLGVATSCALDTLGQVRPGQTVVFRQVDLHDASNAARARRAALDTLRTHVTTVFSCLAAGDRSASTSERSQSCVPQ
ncbi:hypothetical protein GCM10023147_19060 [Tsukamurella soli]|uniref:Carboxyltransferase domain-containing protein n=1 Tax=Tsukamurella soli TaxID=644556 RepID=A0ABP8JHK0_9ACTN